MNLKEKFKRNKGITLIALVVTIIVLLILAGISISMLTGQNGILNRAAEAKEKTGSAQTEELIKLSVTDAISQGLGSLTDENLKTALNNNIGVGKYEISGNETSGWTITKDEKSYKVEPTGSVSETVAINWDKILEEANENPESMKHPDQVKSEYIGIGTDGEPVNMDFWEATEYSEGWELMSTESAYQRESVYSGGFDLASGEIVGKIPQYIYSTEKNKFCEVYSLYYTFYRCQGLKIAPEIPSTVTVMEGTFCGCEYLTKAPEIPNSVTDMISAFEDCSNLTGEIYINANQTGDLNWASCFQGTTKPIQLTGTCPYLSELAATCKNGNVTVK